MSKNCKFLHYTPPGVAVFFWVIYGKFVIQKKNVKKIDEHFHVIDEKKFAVMV